MTEHDLAYGIQTSVDLAPESWEHWAFNLGVKYLNTTAAFAGTPGEVNVDPLIWRAMLVYRGEFGLVSRALHLYRLFPE
jgi:hypothetical protein